MIRSLTPPFGTYALPLSQEAWRSRASQYGPSKWGRMLISLCRKRALKPQKGDEAQTIFDVEIEAGVKARLYPFQNRCEKRAFAGVQIWDAHERQALRAAIETPSERPFVFLDVGANVGLYSLYANKYARDAKREIEIFAIEPGLETCARLEANAAVNAANIRILRVAVSDTPGTGYLSQDTGNRGEAKLDDRDDTDAQETVLIDTVSRICRANGLTWIDAMKLDIEGHDEKALSAFFKDAVTELYPKLLIIETGGDQNAPLIALCAAHGYRVEGHFGLNAILTHTDTPSEL